MSTDQQATVVCRHCGGKICACDNPFQPCRKCIDGAKFIKALAIVQKQYAGAIAILAKDD